MQCSIYCHLFSSLPDSNHFRTDGHFGSTVDSIVSAVRNALEDYSSQGKKVKRSFGSAWIACAGIDRPGMRERVLKDILPILDVDDQATVRITNDVDLLAAVMSRHPETTSSLMVIAGTGSIAARYSTDSSSSSSINGHHHQQTPGRPVRTARTGGWGHLLGDEGSGYTIGRAAIRQALSSVEDLNLGLRTGLSTLGQRIIAQFRKDKVDVNHNHGNGNDNDKYAAQNVDILGSVLTGGRDGDAQNSTRIKTRIASITQTVLDTAAEGDKEAIDIVSSEIWCLINGPLARLLDHRSKGYADPSQCGLILSGAVMLHPAFQTIFQRALAERGARFRYTESVPDAALVGVEYMLGASDGGR